jgi:hypothetical protein
MPLRDFRYQPQARLAVDEALEKWARTDDAIRDLEWTILRDPLLGKALTESGLTRGLTLQGAASIGLPTVTYVYEVEPERIVVHSARFEDAKPETRH